MAAGTDGVCTDTASCKEEEAQTEKKGQPHDDAFACICNHCAVSGGADWQPCDKGSDIDVETVAYGTIDTPEVYTGLILRKEYVVDSTRDGQPYYQYSQGDYVPKGAVVCTVKDTDSTDALESKLNQIDEDILPYSLEALYEILSGIDRDM